MLGSGKDIVHFMRATKSLASAIYVAKRLSKHAIDVMRHGRGMMLTNGNALAGRLAKSAFDLNIPLWLSSPVRELIVEDGAVRGAVVERQGKLIRVNAKRGVVLACGGFPHDVARRKAMFPHAPNGTEHFSPGPAGNTGDGLRLAEAAGGRIEDTLPNAAAWVPVSITERKDGSKGVMPHFIDRAKPGVIAVMRDGRRFANEGNSYHDFVQAMVKAAKPGEEIAAYLICDHRALRKYGLGCVPPFPMPLGHHLATGYLKRGATLAELADRTGIDRQGLEATVAEFNAPAAEGRDPAFGKGSRAYNRYQGDALHGPNPCVAPIKDGPFYAIKLVIGDLGTYAGIRTDEHARALDARRPADRGPLCRRQRHGEHHGRQLSRRRHHARAGADVRVYRGEAYRGRGFTLAGRRGSRRLPDRALSSSTDMGRNVFPSDCIKSDGRSFMRARSSALPWHSFRALLALAGETEWRRYAIPSTGTNVEMPVTIFTRDAGPARRRNGAALFHRRQPRRSDGAVCSESGIMICPPCSLTKKKPPAGIIYRRVTPGLLRRVQRSQRPHLVQPLQPRERQRCTA